MSGRPIFKLRPLSKSKSSKKNKTSSKNIESTQTPVDASKKRKGSPVESREAKKTTEVMTLSHDDLKKMFADQTETMKNEFRATLRDELKTMGEELKIDLQNQLKEDIKVMGDGLKSELQGQIDRINTRIHVIEENINVQLNEMRGNVDKCNERSSVNDDDLIRLSKLNELRIKGIPYSNDENLNGLFGSISQQIGFDTNNPNHWPDLVRSYKRNYQTNETTPLPMIIVKFMAKHIRNRFYSLYLDRIKTKPILLEHIGLSQGGAIVIGENLTVNNQTIFKEALKMKRDKQILRVKTVDGLVYIKPTATANPILIRSQRDLSIFLASAESSKSVSSLTANNRNNNDMVIDNNNASTPMFNSATPYQQQDNAQQSLQINSISTPVVHQTQST